MTTNITYTFYEIVCKDEKIDYIYVGSTKCFKNRKCHHKNSSLNEKYKTFNLPLYQYIRENGGWDNFEMRPIEILDCETKTHARIREQYWIEQKKSQLNDKRAYNTHNYNVEYKKNINKNYMKTYTELNKKKIKEYKKQYQENHREEKREYDRKRREELKLDNITKHNQITVPIDTSTLV